MPGKKFHYKYWKSLSFQEQMEQTKPVETPPKKLVIEKKRKKKKRTATTIHLEIKELVNSNKHDQARLVLKQALQDGYKGKRLNRWSQELFMGNTVKSMREKKVLQNEQKEDNKQTVETEELKQMTEFDIPDLPLEDEEEIEVTDSSVQDESGGSVVFGIVGAGQCGGRLAESFYKLGYKKVLAINTAQHDLDGLSDVPDSQRILMETKTGGGAGKDMKLGEETAAAAQQEIYERMQEIFGEVDRILVCAGAGGGTGGGACLPLVETAKKYLSYIGVDDVNSKVGVLLTLPTKGEANSPTVASNAHLLATKLCKYAEEGAISPLLIFDNDKIDKKYPNLTVKRFWPTVNATVTGLFHMFNVLSKQASEITSFDPADYNKVLGAGGCMIMGLTTLKEYADGTDISKAIRSNLEKGLLCGGFDVSTAKAAACIATAPSEVLENTPGLMKSLETGFDTLANITGNAAVFRGIYEVNKKKFVVYTALTGLATPQKRLNELEKQLTNKVEKTKLYG